MRPSWYIALLLLTACEIFPTAPDPNAFPQPEKTPVFEFTYVNSGSFPGWIKFQNKCVAINSYKWYLGVNDESGNELTSFSSAPRIQYPQNGTYRVIVQGKSLDGKDFERQFLVDVSNY
ncbi:MAG: hypothetical protein RIF39_12380 [Cyclobacteriaceae bacterium]